jgi:hypothetical protein
MEFTEKFAYRRNFSPETFCDQTTINSGNLFAPVADILCRAGCNYQNEVIGTTDEYCSTFSVQDNWSYGYYSWVCLFYYRNPLPTGTCFCTFVL